MRSRVAWGVTLFFAFQSVQAYVAFGWFERFLNAHGIGATTAGRMVALLSAMGIPVSMIVPNGRCATPGGRSALAAFRVLAYVGLGVRLPAAAVAVDGAGRHRGGMFPFALALIGIPLGTPATPRRCRPSRRASATSSQAAAHCCSACCTA